MLGNDLRIGFAPAATYGRMLQAGNVGTTSDLLARLALTVVSIAILAGMAVTGRINITVAVGALVTALLAVVIQLIPAVLLVTLSRRRTLPPASALNLLFAGHLPWSLWLVGVTTWAACSGASFSSGPTFSMGGVLVAAVPAAAWTCIVLAAFCRTVLGTTPSGARVRVAVHQAVLWGITLSYIAWAAGGWFQLWIW